MPAQQATEALSIIELASIVSECLKDKSPNRISPYIGPQEMDWCALTVIDGLPELHISGHFTGYKIRQAAIDHAGNITLTEFCSDDGDSAQLTLTFARRSPSMSMAHVRAHLMSLGASFDVPPIQSGLLSASNREFVRSQWDGSATLVEDADLLVAYQAATRRLVAAVDGRFGRPEFRKLSNEAKERGIQWNSLTVYCSIATYYGEATEVIQWCPLHAAA